MDVNKLDLILQKLTDMEMRLNELHMTVLAVNERQRNMLIRTNQPFPFQPDHTHVISKVQPIDAKIFSG